MQITQIISLPRAKVDQLLMMIPFYKEVKQADAYQYEVLLHHSRIVSYDQGELVIAKGDIDTWMYYVLKGKFIVYPGNKENPGEEVNQITPGEVFGDMAMLVDGRRNATVTADTKSKETQAFGTDFSIFGALEDTRILTIKTKLLFYRRMVHSIRWKLEQYKIKHPTHRFVEDMRKVKFYTGPKDTKEELQSLFAQSKALADILIAWNMEFGAEGSNDQKEFDASAIDSIGLA